MSTNELKNVTSFDKFAKELQEEIGSIEKDSSFKLKGIHYSIYFAKWGHM